MADDLLNKLAQELRVNTLLVSKQYRNRDPNSWFSDILDTAPGTLVQSHGRN